MERRPMPMTSAECVAKGASSFFSHRSRVRDFGWSSLGRWRRRNEKEGVCGPGHNFRLCSDRKAKKRNGRGTTYSQRRRCKHLLSSFARSCFQSCSEVPGKKEFRRENDRACSHSCQFALFFVEGSNYTQRNHRRQSCAIHGNRFVSLFRLPNQAFNQNDISV